MDEPGRYAFDDHGLGTLDERLAIDVGEHHLAVIAAVRDGVEHALGDGHLALGDMRRQRHTQGGRHVLGDAAQLIVEIGARVIDIDDHRAGEKQGEQDDDNDDQLPQ